MEVVEQLSEYIDGISKKYNKHLKLAHINAQSLCDVAHYSEFCDDFANSGIDIIAVSETFFKNSSLTSLPNYTPHTVNRIDRNGGGVALYVKNNLQTKVLAMSDGTSGKPEYIICEVDVGSVKILCACAHRPPHIGYMDLFLLIYTSHWLITNMFLCVEI